MSRDGCHAAGLQPLPLLRRVRQLDATQQVATDLDRGRGNVHRSADFCRRDLRVVEHPGRVDPSPVPEHLLRDHDHHRHLERQPADAIRRLLHDVGPAGDPQPETQGRPTATRLVRLVLPGNRGQARSLHARDRPGGVRAVCDRRGTVPLVHSRRDSRLPLHRPEALRSAECRNRPGDRFDHDHPVQSPAEHLQAGHRPEDRTIEPTQDRILPGPVCDAGRHGPGRPAATARGSHVPDRTPRCATRLHRHLRSTRGQTGSTR